MTSPVLAGHATRLIEKLTCVIMKNGKKSLARRIVENSFKEVAETSSQRPELVFLSAVTNAAPPMVLKNMKRGSQRVKIPFPITEEQRYNLGVRMIVKEARNGAKNKPMDVKLANEILEAAADRGGAVAKRNRLIQEIEHSRGNVFLRWA